MNEMDEQVAVFGSWDGWRGPSYLWPSMGGGGVWEAELTLRPGRHELSAPRSFTQPAGEGRPRKRFCPYRFYFAVCRGGMRVNGGVCNVRVQTSQ
jgi:hypothetical protein